MAAGLGDKGVVPPIVLVTRLRHSAVASPTIGGVTGPAREAPLLVVLLVLAAGLTAVGLDYWRKGLYVVAVALLLAGALRLVLPARRAGLLVVRGRVVDVVILGVLGVLLGTLAAAVPATPV